MGSWCRGMPRHQLTDHDPIEFPDLALHNLLLPEAELLVATIRGKGARLAVPGIVDLSNLVADSSGVARIVLEAVQDMLLRVALQTARDDYETPS